MNEMHPKRINVLLSKIVYNMLATIADADGTTKTAALRKSVLLTGHIMAAKSTGAKVYIDRDGKISELLFEG